MFCLIQRMKIAVFRNLSKPVARNRFYEFRFS